MLKISKINQGKFILNYKELAVRFLRYVKMEKRYSDNDEVVSKMATLRALQDLFEGSQVEIVPTPEEIVLESKWNNIY